MTSARTRPDERSATDLDGGRPGRPGATPGAQSLQRALALLELLGERDNEVSVSDLAASTGLPLPTIHRHIRALVEFGFVRQYPSRKYGLGPRLIHLGGRASRAMGSWALPALAQLVEGVGETANLAVREGSSVVYIAQTPSKHNMRMFTEVGRRVELHCTGVGKAILSTLPPEQVREFLERAGMPSKTDRTIVDIDEFLDEMERTRERGYAIDEGEQEVGVRCIAVVVPSARDGAPTSMALSVSGPLSRLGAATERRAVPLLQRTARELAVQLDGVG